MLFPFLGRWHGISGYFCRTKNALTTNNFFNLFLKKFFYVDVLDAIGTRGQYKQEHSPGRYVLNIQFSLK